MCVTADRNNEGRQRIVLSASGAQKRVTRIVLDEISRCRREAYWNRSPEILEPARDKPMSPSRRELMTDFLQLRSAMLCSECEVISQNCAACPACGSDSLFGLWRFLPSFQNSARLKMKSSVIEMPRREQAI